jgi:hypothetical protein
MKPKTGMYALLQDASGFPIALEDHHVLRAFLSRGTSGGHSGRTGAYYGNVDPSLADRGQ